jgi:hypothetical protein
MPLANEVRLRGSVRITRTPRDRGWQTTVKLSFYDNGVFSVNDIPLNPNESQGMDVVDERMHKVLDVIVNEFKRQVKDQLAQSGENREPQPGDTVIELRDGVPVIYTQPEEGRQDDAPA